MTKHQQAAIALAARWLSHIPNNKMVSDEQYAHLMSIPVEQVYATNDLIDRITDALENGNFEITDDGRLIFEPLAVEWGDDHD